MGCEISQTGHSILSRIIKYEYTNFITSFPKDTCVETQKYIQIGIAWVAPTTIGNM